MVDDDQLFPTDKSNKPDERQEEARQKLEQLVDVLDDIELVNDWAEDFIASNYSKMELNVSYKLSPAYLEKVDQLYERYHHLLEG